ncbi:hypothetical protein G9A89_018075 [Geosiphon pyriformis]|nr:hypothetical protein G9A89_018075 [Geosiphon pyriformis]
MILISDWVSCETPITAIWHMTNAKIKEAMFSKILKIKNYLSEPVDIVFIPNSNAFLDIETGPEEFHEHYQNLAPTREEQEQHLEKINTQLCDHCLISCDFQYCNKCDLIYNLPPHMIYTILKKNEPISHCVLELESTFNSNSNFDNDDNKNNSSSSAQYNNKNNNNPDPNSNHETYIALPNFIKKPEHMHNTDAEFNLRYLEKDPIKLEPHLHTCIDLKIALEILATTMVQLASRSSLAKKGINIRGGIIDAGYIGNIIAMLQNNSEKTYIIDPNKKIAQAIFLPLMKVAQLVLVRNREKLGITVRGIQGFELMGRIDVTVNMAEEEHMLAIKREVKNQAQLFKAEATICKSEEIGLTNLYISAKSPKNITIPIYNTIESVIKIPKGTIIGYLTTKVEDQLPNHIPDFPQLCKYVDITSQTIYE